MESSFTIFIHSLNVVVTCAILLTVFIKNKKNTAINAFFLLLGFILLYNFFCAVAEAHRALNLQNEYFLLSHKFSDMTMVLIPFSLLHFSLRFPRCTIRRPEIITRSLYVAAIALAVLVISENYVGRRTLIMNHETGSIEYHRQYGVLWYPVNIVLLAVALTCVFIIVLQWFRTRSSHERYQILYVGLGILLSIVFLNVTFVLLPAVLDDQRYTIVGEASMLLPPLFTAMAIRSDGLVQFKVSFIKTIVTVFTLILIFSLLLLVGLFFIHQSGIQILELATITVLVGLVGFFYYRKIFPVLVDLLKHHFLKKDKLFNEFLFTVSRLENSSEFIDYFANFLLGILPDIDMTIVAYDREQKTVSLKTTGFYSENQIAEMEKLIIGTEKFFYRVNPGLVSLDSCRDALHPDFFDHLKNQKVRYIEPLVGFSSRADSSVELGYLALGNKKLTRPEFRLLGELTLAASLILHRIFLLNRQKTRGPAVLTGIDPDDLLHSQTRPLGNGLSIVYRTRMMQDILDLAERVARATANVLILGETGTGKEILARFIHYNSPRKDQIFIPINCGAIPESLMESELFGYEKGAFTGADKTHPGLFEQAQDGTLFLDEIGDAPPAIQLKILRVIQEKKFKRLGGKNEISVNVRLIFATHKNLKEGVENKSFREDLFYRIQVLEITMPPLRERIEDIPLLSRYFLRKAARESEKETKSLTQEALENLVLYPWPGNVRELENEISRAVILSSGPVLQATDFSKKIHEKIRNGSANGNNAPGFISPATGNLDEKTSLNLRESLERYEHEILQYALSRFSGNKSKAAKFLGLDRTSFMRKLKKYPR